MKISYSAQELLCLRHEGRNDAVDVLKLFSEPHQKILVHHNYHFSPPQTHPWEYSWNPTYKYPEPNPLNCVAPSSYIVKVNGKVQQDAVAYLCTSGDVNYGGNWQGYQPEYLDFKYAQYYEKYMTTPPTNGLRVKGENTAKLSEPATGISSGSLQYEQRESGLALLTGSSDSMSVLIQIPKF